MCQLEDVYHALCGHWADKPNIRHHCIKSRDHSEVSPRTYSLFTSSDSSSSTHTSDTSSSSSSHTTSTYRSSTPCHDPQKSHSRTEHHHKCSKCTINIDKIVSKHSGMWFSCYLDSITGKPKYKDREGESHASRAARTDKGKRLTKERPRQSKGASEGEEEKETSRNNSWSSHGHVEL